MNKKKKDYALYLAYIVFTLDDAKSDIITLIGKNSHNSADVEKLWNEVVKIIPCNIKASEILIETMKTFKKKLFNKNVSINKNFKILEKYLEENFFTQ